ncbi:unnamed protein product [Peronospora effusa]|nr:unnamed protein product [Peronospora effusa]
MVKEHRGAAASVIASPTATLHITSSKLLVENVCGKELLHCLSMSRSPESAFADESTVLDDVLHNVRGGYNEAHKQAFKSPQNESRFNFGSSG